MLVHLVDIDSTIPNVALMKISAYHKALGDEVRLSKGIHAGVSDADKIYVSCIFKKNKSKVDIFVNSLNNDYHGSIAEIDVGGSGIDLQKKLPPEIENIKPDYSLYPEFDYSIGFSTRGCFRNCHFCVVPTKEGMFKKVNHPETWYNPEYDKIVFLDNNILTNRKHFMKITDWCLEKNLKVWFTQGLDIRRVNAQIANRLLELKHFRMIAFAWDNINDESVIREKINLLKENGFTDNILRAYVSFYVYVDSDKEYESGVYRCKELRKLNCNAYVMYNIDNKPTSRIIDLKRWSKGKNYFWGYDLEDFVKWQHHLSDNKMKLVDFEYDKWLDSQDDNIDETQDDNINNIDETQIVEDLQCIDNWL